MSVPYHLRPTNQYGAVWIALTGGMTGKGGKTISRGDYGEAKPGDDILFSPEGSSRPGLIIISVQTEKQPLTITPVTIDPGGVMADASDRNTTLLIALNNLAITDITSSGEEENWRVGKPEKIAMQAGEVRWIKPGVHKLKNVKSTKSELITIEW
ncbi:hypothetical protein [Acetobacter nitrogenifigens]|uniref:hypothetical protein n=1 Tax=Acetobacter nitrogenifigens TaxID=285268 RepID=UPI00222EA147|nr:hypothetical protein [Acetobacter nitrogenifigens]